MQLACRSGGHKSKLMGSLPEPEDSEDAEPEGDWSHKRPSVVLVNLAAVLEKLDEQLLPSLYAAVSASFAATAQQLGYLTLGRALVQALASPLGGMAGQRYDRVKVTAAGCLLWATMTACFGLSMSLWQGVLVWSVNGAGLALVIPTGQSLIADYHAPTERGMAFGVLYLTSSAGGMAAAYFATTMNDVTVLGLPGWRAAFMCVAALSATVGLLTLRLARDPDTGPRKPVQLVTFYQHVCGFLRIPSFVIIVLQGIFGSIPWQALVYLTLYFQLLGMTSATAGLLNALFLGANALGALLGGRIGDWSAVRWPGHGRVFVCQFSVAVGPIFALVLFKGMPYSSSTQSAALYGVLLVACGLLKCWAAPAGNNPIFAELVPQQLRSMVYAFDRCFEGALAAMVAPLVGWLADHAFGLKGTVAPTGIPAVDLPKAKALGSSLLLFTAVPWTICLLMYSGLHLTYPRDCKSGPAKAGADRLKSAERPLDRTPLRAVSLSDQE